MSSNLDYFVLLYGFYPILGLITSGNVDNLLYNTQNKVDAFGIGIYTVKSDYFYQDVGGVDKLTGLHLPDVPATLTLTLVSSSPSVSSFSRVFTPSSGPAGAVPEPATWALMLIGVGAIAPRVSRQSSHGALPSLHAQACEEGGALFSFMLHGNCNTKKKSLQDFPGGFSFSAH